MSGRSSHHIVWCTPLESVNRICAALGGGGLEVEYFPFSFRLPVKAASKLPTKEI